MARRSIDVAERRARLGRRHRLAAGAQAADPVEAARSLVALHATDPATVHLALVPRVEAPDVAATERALYDERTLVRVLAMRRTMFVVPVELLPVVHAAATAALAPKERRRLVRDLEGHGVAEDGDAWLTAVEDDTVEALAARGEATAVELGADVPGLRTKLALDEGTAWASAYGVATWVLSGLSTQGRIVRGRPRGTWASSRYRWATTSAWLGTEPPSLDPAVARAELARRWLGAFGPAPADDLRWWTGWTVGQVKAALASVAPAEVDLDGATGLLLADDLAPVADPGPWVALLPALDPTVMGWKGRSWYLGDHGPALFDRFGNAGPTVWADGRVVGGWGQRADGAVATRLLEDVGADVAAAVEEAAGRLRAYFLASGVVRVTPRFRTPLERELAAG